jgi:hypothetical protein
MFKSLQVLRTAVAVKSLTGVKVPAGTRVVVVNAKDIENGEWVITARVQDPSFPELAKARVSLTETQVATTKRGRPTAEKV